MDINKIYKENYMILYKGFYKLLPQKEILEELIDDSFIVFMKRYDESQSKPITYLYIILYSKIKEYYRTKTRNNYYKNVELNDNIHVYDDEKYDFMKDVKITILEELLKILNKRDTKVIKLYLEKKSLNEISETLNLKYNTVKTIIHNTKRKMRRHYIKYIQK